MFKGYNYKINHPFSMTITVEENLKETQKAGKLYSEMTAIN
ncbi:MAG: hypothetical protein OXC03_09215 [Flavobacteriaceae bacterium]|nr:hypothetical protein [Flavobacteriaceae bacterium]